MRYSLTLKGSAEREFMALPASVRAQVATRLDALEQAPRPVGVQSLSGELRGFLRIRVGEYRVVYHVDDTTRTITVARIRHRSKVYR